MWEPHWDENFCLSSVTKYDVRLKLLSEQVYQATVHDNNTVQHAALDYWMCESCNYLKEKNNAGEYFITSLSQGRAASVSVLRHKFPRSFRNRNQPNASVAWGCFVLQQLVSWGLYQLSHSLPPVFPQSFTIVSWHWLHIHTEHVPQKTLTQQSLLYSSSC